MRGAVDMALRTHGPEVLGFLHTSMGTAADADEAFSLFCEDVWKGLPRFEWRCSLRTWVYVLARNAGLRYGARASRQLLHQGQPIDSEVLNLAAEVRLSTASNLRGERLELVHRLRRSLSVEEQMLLTLRIDRQLEWVDIARIFEPEAADPRRAATALRKRFQRLKERLRAQMAPEARP